MARLRLEADFRGPSVLTRHTFQAKNAQVNIMAEQTNNPTSTRVAGVLVALTI